MSATIELNYEEIYRLASERSELDALEHNIFNLYYLNRVSYDFRILLRTESVTLAQKLEVVKDLPCFQASTVFLELMEIIFANHLSDRIHTIYQAFSKEIDKKLNRLVVQVYSAVPLTLSIQTNLVSKISSVLSKDVKIKNFIDENLVGGLIIKLPNGKIFDLTSAKILSDLKYYLTENN